MAATENSEELTASVSVLITGKAVGSANLAELARLRLIAIEFD